MQELKINLKCFGLPLIMSNPRTVDPLDIYTIRLNELKGVQSKKRTEDDLKLIARLEWESGLYINNGFVAIPTKYIESCLHQSSKKARKGQDIVQGVNMLDSFVQLKYSGLIMKNIVEAKALRDLPNITLDEYFIEEFIDKRIITNKKTGNAFCVYKPKFENWHVENIVIVFDEAIINKRSIIERLEYGGKYLGIGSYRNFGYGRFGVEVLE